MSSIYPQRDRALRRLTGLFSAQSAANSGQHAGIYAFMELLNIAEGWPSRSGVLGKRKSAPASSSRPSCASARPRAAGAEARNGAVRAGGGAVQIAGGSDLRCHPGAAGAGRHAHRRQRPANRRPCQGAWLQRGDGQRAGIRAGRWARVRELAAGIVTRANAVRASSSHQLPLTIPSGGRQRRVADCGQQWVPPASTMTAGMAKRGQARPAEACKRPRNFVSNLLRI